MDIVSGPPSMPPDADALVATGSGRDETSRIRRQRHLLWKRNAPYLYEFTMIHALEWPSLTVQWLPHSTKVGSCLAHGLLLGTHTSDKEPNTVMLAAMHLPDTEDSRPFDANRLWSQKMGFSTKKIEDSGCNGSLLH